MFGFQHCVEQNLFFPMMTILSELLMSNIYKYSCENGVPVTWFFDLKYWKLTQDRKIRRFWKFLLHDIYWPIIRPPNCHIFGSSLHRLSQSSHAQNGYVKKWRKIFIPIKIQKSAWISIFRDSQVVANCLIYGLKNIVGNFNVISRSSGIKYHSHYLGVEK